MNFGEALEAMKSGECVRREGWNGKGMYVYLLDGVELLDDGSCFSEPFIVMFTAQRNHQPGWLASQADMLADDWELLAEDASKKQAVKASKNERADTRGFDLQSCGSTRYDDMDAALRNRK